MGVAVGGESCIVWQAKNVEGAGAGCCGIASSLGALGHLGRVSDVPQRRAIPANNIAAAKPPDRELKKTRGSLILPLPFCHSLTRGKRGSRQPVTSAKLATDPLPVPGFGRRAQGSGPRALGTP